ncbi:MAG: hypothetical protein HPY64_11870 [Anaerolineae bacterium]|nr:hypothetical protein [Anaerolineae bacterium]
MTVMAKTTQRSRKKAPPSDVELAQALRRGALALAEAVPDKIADAPLHQVAAALKTTIELIRMLEAPDDATHEQVIRWEFAYDGAVHAAPPWAGAGDGSSGPLPGGGLWPPLGQDGTGQGGPA